MSVSNEAIEVVARAIWEATGHRHSDWIYMAPEIPRKQRYMSYATAALTAAAPAIQAAALREFAHALTAMITVYAERTTEYDAGWVAGMTSSIAGLTARADQLEGETN